MRRLRTAPTVLFLLVSLSAFKCNLEHKPDQLAPQSNGATPAATPALPLATLRREFGNPFPIKTGEKHVFEIRFSRFPIYATVGTITFEFLGPTSGAQFAPRIEGLNIDFTPDPTEQFFRFRASVVSKGILVAIIGVDVKDRFETLLDAKDFSARLSFKEIKEGKKNTVQSSIFDPDRKTVQFKLNDVTKPDAPPREKTLERIDGSLDLLTSFYFMRLQKLKEGQALRFPVSDDGENHEFEIVVGKHEKLSTDCGKVKTIRLEPKLFGPGKFFSRPGEMTMWVTDDKLHTPLRLVAKTPSGTLSAKLTNFKNNCQITEPDPEGKEQEVAPQKPQMDKRRKTTLTDPR
ncbi:MAG: DUF3108 domain-containing protein [Blastocatellia bacterium]